MLHQCIRAIDSHMRRGFTAGICSMFTSTLYLAVCILFPKTRCGQMLLCTPHLMWRISFFSSIHVAVECASILCSSENYHYLDNYFTTQHTIVSSWSWRTVVVNCWLLVSYVTLTYILSIPSISAQSNDPLPSSSLHSIHCSPLIKPVSF